MRIGPRKREHPGRRFTFATNFKSGNSGDLCPPQKSKSPVSALVRRYKVEEVWFTSALADVQLSPAGDTLRPIALYSTLPQEEFQIAQEAP